MRARRTPRQLRFANGWQKRGLFAKGWQIHVAGLLAGVFLLAGAWVPAAAAARESRGGGWEKMEGAVLGDGYADADSFNIRHKGKTHIIRLYFVDAPETDDRFPDRLQEQADYFGIPYNRVMPLGKDGEKFTRSLLSGKSFTVWTRWLDARGASRDKRYFGIVEVGGQDLAELLVANGLVRIVGAGTVTPKGRSVDAQFARLRQIENRAKARKAGGWAERGSKGKKVRTLEGAFDVAFADDDGPLSDGFTLDGAKRSKATGMKDKGTSLLNELLAEGEGPGVFDGKWPSVPTVAFLRAEVFINSEQFEDAEIEMRKLLRRFPDHPQRARIEFYYALSIAMQERFRTAIALFQSWLVRFPNHQLVADVNYWMPICMYYYGDFEPAIPLFEAFAKNYPFSVYAPEAVYRVACCRYALEDYDTCIPELRDWLEKNPEHYFRYEAALMLGDALAAAGKLDEAKTAYRLAMKREAGPFYYMALTQIARVHKALGEPEDIKDLARDYVQFIKDRPNDSNIIDAAYHAGAAYRQLRQEEAARRLYWQMIELHGNTPAWEGFDLMLTDLARMYPPDDPQAYPAELRARNEKALASQRLTLASRLNLAEIMQLPADKQYAALPTFAGRFRVELLGPETLAWLGNAWLAAGHQENGIANLELLLDRYPESRHATGAHAVLARESIEAKDYDLALFHANFVLQNPAEIADIMTATFARAEALQGLGSFAEAVADYNTILATRAAPAYMKPEALLGIGECLEAQKKYAEAIPYYQRIYVMYRAYKEAVIQAYLRSGACFEKLKDKPAAINTYREFLESDFAPGTGAAATARQRIAKLSGGGS